MTIRDKFHSYIEKYRTAIVAEKELGRDHDTTIEYFKIAQSSKAELVHDLDEAEKFVDELILRETNAS